MPKQTVIRHNLKGIAGFEKEMRQYRARVGILGDKAAQDHTLKENKEKGIFRTTEGQLDNATLGIIQMFGSIKNNIPSRDFLFMPIETHAKEIIKAMGSTLVRKLIAEGEYKKVYAALGAKAMEFVLMAFETSGFGQWEANAYITIYGGWMKNKISGKYFYVKGKKSSRPLIDTGQLHRAIANDVVNASEVK